MNREQFITTCIQSGYAGKQAAEEYADNSGKEEFEIGGLEWRMIV